MDPAKAARAFPRLIAAMRTILHRHDPSGLFGMGAPEDEHDGSICRIISGLQLVRECNEVASILEAELGDWIADNGNDPEKVCQAMAPEVWEAWSTFQDRVE